MKSFSLIFFFILSTVFAVYSRTDHNCKNKYIAQISSNPENGQELLLKMQTTRQYDNLPYKILFNLNLYKNYVFITPMIDGSEAFCTAADVARGEISFKKKDNLILVAYMDSTVEKFSITSNKDSIRVDVLTLGNCIYFNPKSLDSFPENILMLKMQFDSLISPALNAKLIESGCQQILLDEGEYGFFPIRKIIGHNLKDQYSHISENRAYKSFYFFKVTSDFSTIDSLLKSYQIEKSTNRRLYQYSFNFDLDRKKVFDSTEFKRLRKMTGRQIEESMIWPTEISFWLRKPGNVKIIIKSLDNKKITEIKSFFDATGRVLFNWDANLKNKKKLKYCIYKYDVYCNGVMIASNRYLLVK